ncbi:MAG: carbohydrate-binding family 9-like protein [Candidatus Latescibacterota bacterium]|jgi:hypothetical protein
MDEFYGFAQAGIKEYTCLRTPTPPSIDGRLDEACWQSALRSPRFEDLETGKPGLLDTRVALLWDERCLYVGYWVEEPFLQASLTQRDAFIWYDNDVELFIAGRDAYYELEINALGTIYEVLWVWKDAYRRGSRFDVPELDLLTQRVQTLGDFGHLHPRGARWGFLDWDLPGLQVATHLDGTLNDDTDVDRGWTLELALPWEGLKWLADGRSLPPKEGDEWRMDLSRFEHMRESKGTLAAGWAFNAHTVFDSHVPERFTRIRFSEQSVTAG